MSEKPSDKICPNCGEVISAEYVWRSGYGNAEWQEWRYPEHELQNCIKYLRGLIDKMGK